MEGIRRGTQRVLLTLLLVERCLLEHKHPITVLQHSVPPLLQFMIVPSFTDVFGSNGTNSVPPL